MALRRPWPASPGGRSCVAACAATAPQRAAEPAWHRRERRRRAAARTLLRVADAARLLGDHHSAQRPSSGGDASGASGAMPNGRFGNQAATRGGAGSGPNGRNGGAIGGGGRDAGGGPRPWDCGICGLTANWPSRLRCRECGAHPPGCPPSGGQRGGGGGRGGGNGGGRGGPATGGNGNSGGGTRGGSGGGGTPTLAPAQPTFAQRQLQRQQQETRESRRLADERRKAQDLQAEVNRLQRELASRSRGRGGNEDADDLGDDDGDGMDTSDDQYATWSEEERQRQVELTRSSLPYLEQRFGAESAELAQAKAEIEALQRASREAKPYRTHRAQLERRKARLENQQERDGEEVEQLQAQIDAAQERMGKLREAMDERAKTIDSVGAELKELLRRALAENEDQQTPAAASPPAPAPRAEAWGAVEATLSDLADNGQLPAEQKQQLTSFLSLFRQVATNVLASSGGAALATPPACGPRWAAGARKAATEAAAANTAQDKSGGQRGQGAADGKSGDGAQAHPSTPVVPQPATPSQAQQQGTTNGGASSSSSGGGPTGGLLAMPTVLGPKQQASPTRPQPRAGAGKDAEDRETRDASRRQRSNSCSREARKSEAARATAGGMAPAPATAQAAITGASNEVPSNGNLAEAAGHHDGTGATTQGTTATGAANSEGTREVRIATDASEAESGVDDMELWSDAGDCDTAEIDMEIREGETEKDRRARVGAFFKERIRARMGKTGRGVRKPRKGD